MFDFDDNVPEFALKFAEATVGGSIFDNKFHQYVNNILNYKFSYKKSSDDAFKEVFPFKAINKNTRDRFEKFIFDDREFELSYILCKKPRQLIYDKSEILARLCIKESNENTTNNLCWFTLEGEIIFIKKQTGMDQIEYEILVDEDKTFKFTRNVVINYIQSFIFK